MQLLSGRHLMRQQVPMLFLLPLVHLGAVAYNSVEMLAQGYFKGQRSSIIHKLHFFMTLCDMQSSSGNYSTRHKPQNQTFFRGGRKRLPKFKFSAKFPIGLHVILQIQIKKFENDCYLMWKIILTENPSRFDVEPLLK